MVLFRIMAHFFFTLFRICCNGTVPYCDSLNYFETVVLNGSLGQLNAINTHGSFTHVDTMALADSL